MDLDAASSTDVWSVVFYVGQGTGARDPGHYQLNGPDGTPTLTWRYHIVRLWQMQAEALLALGRPALLPLVGQTRVTVPEVVLPEVIARLHNVSDVELRQRLLTIMMALIPDEELADMAERLIESEELLLDTPFLRRMREAGRTEGRAEGRVEGRAEGRVEGQMSGRLEGALLGRRRSILDVLVLRFDPPASVYQKIERHLETLTDETQLATLLAAAIRAENVAAFQAALAQREA